MDICSICLENIDHKINTPCHHVFHPLCLLVWRQQHFSCPLCRQDIATMISGPVHEDKNSKNLLETLAFYEYIEKVKKEFLN